MRDLLVRHYGSVTPVSREMKVTRQTIWNWVRELGLVEFLHAQQKLKPQPVKPVKPPPPPRSVLERYAAFEGVTPEEALKCLARKEAGRVVGMARELGVPYRVMLRLLQEHGLSSYVRGVRDAVQNTYRL